MPVWCRRTIRCPDQDSLNEAPRAAELVASCGCSDSDTHKWSGCSGHLMSAESGGSCRPGERTPGTGCSTRAAGAVGRRRNHCSYCACPRQGRLRFLSRAEEHQGRTTDRRAGMGLATGCSLGGFLTFWPFPRRPTTAALFLTRNPRHRRPQCVGRRPGPGLISATAPGRPSLRTSRGGSAPTVASETTDYGLWPVTTVWSCGAPGAAAARRFSFTIRGDFNNPGRSPGHRSRKLRISLRWTDALPRRVPCCQIVAPPAVEHGQVLLETERRPGLDAIHDARCSLSSNPRPLPPARTLVF
jgi:hypothetical protein